VIPRTARIPEGLLVNDSALTAFLGPTPPGTAELLVSVCPWRLRGSVEARREQLARFILAVVLLTEKEDNRLFVHTEPGLLALLLYGAVRILPRDLLADLTFSTFEPHHCNIRDFKLARVVGTYLGSPEKSLNDLGGGPDLVLDTFDTTCSSPALGEALPDGLNDLVQLVVAGNWPLLDEVHRMAGGAWDTRAWLVEAGERVRAAQKPKTPTPAPDPTSRDPWLADSRERNNRERTRAAQKPKPPALQAEAQSQEWEWEIVLDDPEVVEAVLAPAPVPAPAPAAQPTDASALPAPKPVGGMTYCAQISRTNPACLLFLIDQSQSMAEPFLAGTAQTKAGVVADALNRFIQNVVLRSAKADGVRDYFRVGVIGYGKGVKAGLGGSVPFNVLLPVSQLGAHPLRVETRTKLIPDGVGGVVEQKVKFPVWFDAEANRKTPMCEAFAAAGVAVQGFIEQFPGAYPPIVLNLSDGMPTDGNPQLNARLLTNMGTSDGAALLFNLLISNKPVPTDYFPATEERLPDVCSKLLFRMSSVLPPKLWEAAKAEGHDLHPRARGVVINADPTAIVRFLDIGTRITPSGK
jgi:hypothetical protein